MYIQPLSMEVEWWAFWHQMDVSTMLYICRYCIFTLWGRTGNMQIATPLLSSLDQVPLIICFTDRSVPPFWAIPFFLFYFMFWCFRGVNNLGYWLTTGVTDLNIYNRTVKWIIFLDLRMNDFIIVCILHGGLWFRYLRTNCRRLLYK